MLVLDERGRFALALTLGHGAAFWIPNIFLLVARHLGWFPAYRLTNKPHGQGHQPSKSEELWADEPSPALVQAAMIESAIGHWLVFPVAAYLAFPLLTTLGLRPSGPLPTAASLVIELLFYLFCNETMSYWVHRALHHRLLYRSIHKKHHTFARSVGIAAEYTHPIESLFNGILPLFLGPVLFSMGSGWLAALFPRVFDVPGFGGHGTHGMVLVGWVAARTLDTVNSHSGYQFPFAPFNHLPGCGGAEFHDFHHSHNVGNYGAVTYVWDHLCGTDKAYRAWLSEKKAR